MSVEEHDSTSDLPVDESAPGAFGQSQPGCASQVAMLRLLDAECDQGAGEDDPEAGADDAESSSEQSSSRNEDPALIAAVLLFGRAIARTPAILDRILDGAPILIVDCSSDDWIDPVTGALARCFGPASKRFGRRPGSGRFATGPGAIVVRAQAATSRREATSSDALVGRALRGGRPLIGVAAPGRSRLPAELERAWEERIALGPLTPADLTSIARRIVGEASSTALSVEEAAAIDPMDLRIAVHPAMRADAVVDRLQSLIGRRIGRPTTRPAPRLSDLHGYGAAGAWGVSAAADLKSYARGELSWTACEPGALLTGPPGVGKTLFASALATEAEAGFLAGSLAVWQADGEAHLGTTLKAMLGFFRRARELAPCVALIDELDSFGDRRKAADHNHSYDVKVINGLLECLDGDGGRAGVLLIGATNDASRIDPAILRSGRFDRVIAIERPTLQELPFILRHHLGTELSGCDLRELARVALGGTGADCAAWVRRARGRARRSGREVTHDDVLDEIRGAAGRSSIEDERRAAVHESGHAVVAWHAGLPIGDMVLRSPGHAGDAYVCFEAPRVLTRIVLQDVLATLMAGRAAEILTFRAPSAGAESDLRRATMLARDMHLRWGLGRFLMADDFKTMDGKRERLIEDELRTAARSADRILRRRRSQLDRLAEALLERRSLTAVEVEARLSEAVDARGDGERR